MNNLTEKTGNLKIEEAIFEKWNDLSPKLKLECMKWLDFETRWNLRSASKTSKFIVDSQKIKIDRVLIDSDVQIIEITQNGVIFRKKYVVNNQFIAFYKYLCRHGIMENFIIDGSDYKTFPDLRYGLSVKNAKFNKVSTCAIEFWVHQMNCELLKSVKFHETMESEEIIRVRQNDFIPSFTVNGFNFNENDAGKFAQIWINIHAKIGQKFQIMSAPEKSFEKFSERFSERVVSKSETLVRIKMDYPDRHILLEADFDKQCILMTVISASSGDKDEFMEEKEGETEKPEDLSIAPYEFEKWNELPKEMKLECMKSMNIKSKMNLRQTSKTEKALVDSKKFKIDKAEIDLDAKTVCIDRRKYFQTVEDQVKCCEYILEHGIIENLEVSFDIYNDAVHLLHEAISPYSVKNLRFKLYYGGYVENVKFLLERMSNKLESLEFKIWTSGSFQLHNIASSKISDISFIKIDSIKNIDTADKLAQIWIEKDAKIGNKYQVLVKNIGSFERFSQHFKDRLVSDFKIGFRIGSSYFSFKSDKFLRIKTDNPSKHIILQTGDPSFGDFDQEFLQMTVIPADMIEYETSDEWMHTWRRD